MLISLNKKGQASPASNANPPPNINPPPDIPDIPQNNQRPVKGKRKYTCQVCGERFPSEIALQAHEISAHPGYSPELFKLGEKKKAKRRLYNSDNLVRSAKKHSLILAPFIFLIAVVVVYFVFFASSNVGIVYTEVTYGSLFSKVGSLISSGISSISTFIAEIQNPNLLVSQPQVTSVNSTPTFSSFLTFSYPSNQLVTLTTNPQEGTIFYSVYNNGNVPLGPGTPNNLLVNISCGSTVSSGAAKYCDDMLTKFVSPAETSSNPPKISNLNLLDILAPGETKENTTYFDLQCPPTSDHLTFPLSMSLLATFFIKNYTSAVILPVEFMSSTFQSKLISSAQAFVPSEPSFNFYSAGPIQLEIYTDLRQPVLTKSDAVPIQVTIRNNGNYPYSINNLSIYISKEFYPSDPLASSTNGWNCVTATSTIKQGFQFPGSDYWDCYVDNSRLLGSASSFYLDLNPVSTLSGMHFNTMTIIGYVNYNYNESMNMPVVVSNQTCSK